MALAVSALKEQIEKAKESLKSVDDNIKKVTGRDPNEARFERGRGGNRGRDGVRLGRRLLSDQSGMSGNEPPTKRSGGIFRRIGSISGTSDRHVVVGGRRSSQQHHSDEEDESEPVKPSVQSSVVSTAKSISKSDLISAQNVGEKGKARNRRMFGVLLGTLARFQNDESKANSALKQEQRRNEIERRLEEAQATDRRKAAAERRELFTERRSKQHKIALLEEKIELAGEFEEWEKEWKKKSMFLITKASPPIYFLPKDSTARTTRALKETEQFVKDKIDEARGSLKITLDEIDKEIAALESTKDTKGEEEVKRGHWGGKEGQWGGKKGDGEDIDDLTEEPAVDINVEVDKPDEGGSEGEVGNVGGTEEGVRNLEGTEGGQDDVIGDENEVGEQHVEKREISDKVKGGSDEVGGKLKVGDLEGKQGSEKGEVGVDDKIANGKFDDNEANQVEAELDDEEEEDFEESSPEGLKDVSMKSIDASDDPVVVGDEEGSEDVKMRDPDGDENEVNDDDPNENKLSGSKGDSEERPLMVATLHAVEQSAGDAGIEMIEASKEKSKIQEESVEQMVESSQSDDDVQIVDPPHKPDPEIVEISSSPNSPVKDSRKKPESTRTTSSRRTSDSSRRRLRRSQSPSRRSSTHSHSRRARSPVSSRRSPSKKEKARRKPSPGRSRRGSNRSRGAERRANIRKSSSSSSTSSSDSDSDGGRVRRRKSPRGRAGGKRRYSSSSSDSSSDSSSSSSTSSPPRRRRKSSDRDRGRTSKPRRTSGSRRR